MQFFGFSIFFLLLLAGIATAARLHSEYQRMKESVENSTRLLKAGRVFMNEFTRMLGKVEEIDHAVELVAHHLNEMVDSESFAIFTIDQDAPADKPRLRGLAVCGLFPIFHRVSNVILSRPHHRREHFRYEYHNFGEGVIGEVAQTGKPVLIQQVEKYERAEELPKGIETLMAVPMSVEGKLLGVICAVNIRAENRWFEEEDLQTLQALSHQAALACHQIQVYSARSSQERLAQELEFGRELQHSLLPSEVPQWGDYRFAAFSCPALEVGGDFYDFIEIDEDRLMVVVGDATGKGIPACMLMATCRSFVRSFAEHYQGMEQFLYALNRRMFADTDSFLFVTLAVVVIDRRSNVCEYGNAGHTPMLLRGGHSATALAVRPEGQAAGLMPEEMGVEYQTFSFCFEPGMQLLLFSDGMNEAMDLNGAEFGLDNLKTLWSGDFRTAEGWRDLIVEKVTSHAKDMEQSDDQTMLIVSRAAEPATSAEPPNAPEN
ncbi:MAG: SpoIIE family protein phosphatase [Lentisphaeria bacterium]|nr:SpoIIE family protein phosphatase [Lentisphaeria bacterium]